jgi:hypothetical protein
MASTTVNGSDESKAATTMVTILTNASTEIHNIIARIVPIDQQNDIDALPYLPCLKDKMLTEIKTHLITWLQSIRLLGKISQADVDFIKDYDCTKHLTQTQLQRLIRDGQTGIAPSNQNIELPKLVKIHHLNMCCKLVYDRLLIKFEYSPVGLEPRLCIDNTRAAPFDMPAHRCLTLSQTAHQIDRLRNSYSNDDRRSSWLSRLKKGSLSLGIACYYNIPLPDWIDVQLDTIKGVFNKCGLQPKIKNDWRYELFYEQFMKVLLNGNQGLGEDYYKSFQPTSSFADCNGYFLADVRSRFQSNTPKGSTTNKAGTDGRPYDVDDIIVKMFNAGSYVFMEANKCNTSFDKHSRFDLNLLSTTGRQVHGGGPHIRNGNLSVSVARPLFARTDSALHTRATNNVDVAVHQTMSTLHNRGIGGWTPNHQQSIPPQPRRGSQLGHVERFPAQLTNSLAVIPIQPPKTAPPTGTGGTGGTSDTSGTGTQPKPTDPLKTPNDLTNTPQNKNQNLNCITPAGKHTEETPTAGMTYTYVNLTVGLKKPQHSQKQQQHRVAFDLTGQDQSDNGAAHQNKHVVGDRLGCNQSGGQATHDVSTSHQGGCTGQDGTSQPKDTGNGSFVTSIAGMKEKGGSLFLETTTHKHNTSSIGGCNKSQIGVYAAETHSTHTGQTEKSTLPGQTIASSNAESVSPSGSEEMLESISSKDSETNMDVDILDSGTQHDDNDAMDLQTTMNQSDGRMECNDYEKQGEAGDATSIGMHHTSNTTDNSTKTEVVFSLKDHRICRGYQKYSHSIPALYEVFQENSELWNNYETIHSRLAGPAVEMLDLFVLMTEKKKSNLHICKYENDLLQSAESTIRELLSSHPSIAGISLDDQSWLEKAKKYCLDFYTKSETVRC